MSVNGIDISKWQGNINWEEVKKSDVKFVMIRASYGFVVDERFNYNIANAQRAGIPVGIYHYCLALNKAEAIKEAEFFAEQIKKYKFEYPAALDLEDKSISALNKSEITNIAYSFLNYIETQGYYSMLYVNRAWYENKIDMNILKKFDIWLAEWGKELDYKNGIGIWQYSSSGNIRGINGNVDLDISFKNYPEIIKNCGLNNWEDVNMCDNTVPDWQIKAFENLVNNGIIETEEFWRNKLSENITAGEVMGIISNLYNKISSDNK